jgi:hypothetical protein
MRLAKIDVPPKFQEFTNAFDAYLTAIRHQMPHLPEDFAATLAFGVLLIRSHTRRDFPAMSLDEASEFAFQLAQLFLPEPDEEAAEKSPEKPAENPTTSSSPDLDTSDADFDDGLTDVTPRGVC